MSVAAYAEMKDSGFEPLGAVPAHWVVTALKRYATFVYGDALAAEIRRDGATPVFGSNGIVGLHDEPNTLAPAIFIGRKGSCGALSWSYEAGFAIDTAYYVDARSTKANLKWLYWALHVLGLSKLSQDTGVPGLSREIAHESLLAFPSLPEQTAIASFLDRETRKIDALVEEQRRLIALLKEKRQAVISHAVTKGLDPNAPMKDSGVEWLGEVPAHWEVKRFKHLINSIEQGWSPQCEASPAETENDWAVLKVGCVNGGSFNPEENKTLPPELTPIESLGISEGDLLISRANTRELVGSTAVATKAYPRLMLCDKLYRLRFRAATMLPQFASFYLATPGARGQIEVAATGASSSMVNIGQSTILEMEIAVPPLAEQGSICLAAMAQGGDFRRLVDAAETAIALLAERRAALISAAVTGKIDVRGLAQPEAVAA